MVQTLREEIVRLRQERNAAYAQVADLQRKLRLTALNLTVLAEQLEVQAAEQTNDHNSVA